MTSSLAVPLAGVSSPSFTEPNKQVELTMGSPNQHPALLMAGGAKELPLDPDDSCAPPYEMHQSVHRQSEKLYTDHEGTHPVH